MLERIGRLLTLVQFLIGYGKDLAATLRQQRVMPRFCPTMQACFGTFDPARILIRIVRALKHAAALDSQPRRRTAAGQDVQTHTERAPVQPRAFAHRSTTNSARRAAVRGTDPDNLPDDDRLSEEQIAALIRRVRAGAVIEANCRHLGLVPAVVSEQPWKDVFAKIVTLGGNFDKPIYDAMFRSHRRMTDALDANAPPRSAAIGALERCLWEWTAPA